MARQALIRRAARPATAGEQFAVERVDLVIRRVGDVVFGDGLHPFGGWWLSS
jgi:hypothetical protein